MDQNQYSPTQAHVVPQYQQQPQQQPVQPQPNYGPQGLTGGQKAAWLFIGFLSALRASCLRQ